MDSFIDVFQILGIFVFLAVIFGRTLFLVYRRHINPLKLGIGKKGINQIIELIFLVGLLVWITEVLFSAFHIKIQVLPSYFYTQFIKNTPVIIIGVLCVVLSLIIFIWALVSFRDSWRIGIDTRTNGELITTGIFSFSRNPIFLSINLYFWGTFLINGTLIFLVFAILVAIGMHYQILQEEKFLSQSYGVAYQKYAQLTNRYWGQHQIINLSNK